MKSKKGLLDVGDFMMTIFLLALLLITFSLFITLGKKGTQDSVESILISEGKMTSYFAMQRDALLHQTLLQRVKIDYDLTSLRKIQCIPDHTIYGCEQSRSDILAAG